MLRASCLTLYALRSLQELDEEGEARQSVGSGQFDLVAGCDGVQSSVRTAIAQACGSFRCESAQLPSP